MSLCNCNLFILFFLSVIVFAHTKPKWRGIRVTWGFNHTDKTFVPLPLTEADAIEQGFSLLNEECRGGKFVGYRYVQDLDTAAVIIYDEQGYVAGMQHGVPWKDLEKAGAADMYTNNPNVLSDKIWNGENVYFVTTYFIDPSKICDCGRSKEEFEEQGVGTDLYLQNGTDPIRDSVKIPYFEKDMKDTSWIKGPCVDTMGTHYIHDVNESLTCKRNFPVMPIYDSGRLIGYVYGLIGDYTFSSRMEQLLTYKRLKEVSGGVTITDCMKDLYEKTGGLKRVHVFFKENPWDTECPCNT